MAIRNDLTIDWDASPRIITIDAPSTEITILDLHDSCRSLEASPTNMEDPSLIDSSGLEALGGGTKVGLTTTLQNALVAFEARLGPEYTQCSVAGGNVVAIDDVGSYFTTPIHPTAFTQVVVTASSSATSTSQEALEIGLFQNGVAFDYVNGVSGTGKDTEGNLIGTRQAPSSSVGVVHQLAEDYGLKKIYVIEDATIASISMTDGYEWVGDNPFITVTVESSANLINSAFQNLTVIGELDGFNTVRQCALGAVTDVDGFIFQTALTSTTELSAKTRFLSCYSDIEGAGYPTIKPFTHNFVLRDYKGSVGIDEMEAGSVASIGLTEGRLVVEATSTGGDIYLRGMPFEVIDYSAGAVTIHYQTDSKDVWNIPANGFGTYGFLLEEAWGHTEQRVFVDSELGTDGAGYQQDPHNSWTSAVDHAESDGLLNLTVLSDATVDRQLKNFDIHGVGAPTIDLNGQIMEGTRFFECRITGSYTGFLIIKEGQLSNLSGANGSFKNVSVVGTLTIGANVKIVGMVSGEINVPYTIDMNGATEANAAITNAYDGVIIQNMANVNSEMHIHGGAGGIAIINDTCTAGTIVITGDFKVTDNSAGATVIIREVQSDLTAIEPNITALHQSAFNKRTWNKTSDIITIYDTDNITPIYVFDTNDDMSDITPQ